MKTTAITIPSLFALVVACAGCGGTDAPDEALGAAPGAAGVAAPAYGYEFANDPANAPAERAAAPSQGSSAAAGRLAPEVIQQTVRARFSTMKACYEQALQQSPALAGSVVVRFQIQTDGSVIHAADDGSTIPDQAMVACVVGVFASTSFPTPEGGVVDVVYPVAFSP